MLSLRVPLQFHTSESEVKLDLRAAWLSAEGVHSSSPGLLTRDRSFCCTAIITQRWKGVKHRITLLHR